MSPAQSCLYLHVSVPWSLESLLDMDELLVSEIAASGELCSSIFSLKSSWKRDHILCSVFPELKHVAGHSHTGGGAPVSKKQTGKAMQK